MKKRFLVLFIFTFLIASLLPLQAFAFGGFVSPKGSDTYHDIYCFYVEGYHLSELRWFDTARQAEAAGLKPCEECDAANGFDFTYDIETTWKTSDHLLQSAMELEYESGYLRGRDSGYEEGYSEGMNNSEYSFYNSYDTGYEEGYAAGRESGYDEGYNTGLNAGKGQTEPQFEIDSIIEEERKDAATDAYFIAAIFGLPLCFGLSFYLVGCITQGAQAQKEKKAQFH